MLQNLFIHSHISPLLRPIIQYRPVLESSPIVPQKHSDRFRSLCERCAFRDETPRGFHDLHAYHGGGFRSDVLHIVSTI